MGKLTLYNVQKEVADGLNGAHITFDSIFRAATERILYTLPVFSVTGFTALMYIRTQIALSAFVHLKMH